MPLRILRVRGLVNASLVRGFLVTGMYSTFFLGTLYLEHVRHYSALETGAAFLPWTLTVAVLSQGITARLVARFGPLPVLTGGMASALAGLLVFATVGPDTALLPDDLRRLLRDRPRHRHRLHAAADARDGGRPRRGRRARLRDHQRLPADRRRARPGGARARSPRTTPRGCWPRTTGRASALIGGYQVAFITGAAVIGAGMVLAFALLRPRPPPAGAAARRRTGRRRHPRSDHPRPRGSGSMKQSTTEAIPASPAGRRGSARLRRESSPPTSTSIWGGPVRFRVPRALIRGRSIVQTSRRAENRRTRRRAGVPSRPMHSGRRLLVAVVLARAPAVPAAAAPTTTVQRTIFDCDGDNLLDLPLRRAAPSVRPGIPARGGRGRPVVRSAFGAGDEPRLQPSASIINFLQLSDFQTVDEESPARVEWLDATQRIAGLQPLSAAYRPQESLSDADHRGDGPSRRGTRGSPVDPRRRST